MLKLALLGAAGALLAALANQVPADVDLAWQFNHSTDVAQVEVLRPVTVKDARDKCEMIVWEIRAIRSFKGTLRAGEQVRVWGAVDRNAKAGSERLLFLRKFEGQPYDACSARVFALYRQVHWGACCALDGEGSDARAMFGTVINSEEAGPPVPVRAHATFAALQALADEDARAGPASTTIVALLEDPAAYNGRYVRVTGAAVVRFEATFLCPTEALIDADASKQCLWLAPGDVGDGMMAYDLRPLHAKVVDVVGRFDTWRTGHMGAYGGTIAVTDAAVLGSHGKGNVSPPPPEPPR